MIAVRLDVHGAWLTRVYHRLALAALAACYRHEITEMDRLLAALDRLRPAIARRRRYLP